MKAKSRNSDLPAVCVTLCILIATAGIWMRVAPAGASSTAVSSSAEADSSVGIDVSAISEEEQASLPEPLPPTALDAKPKEPVERRSLSVKTGAPDGTEVNTTETPPPPSTSHDAKQINGDAGSETKQDSSDSDEEDRTSKDKDAHEDQPANDSGAKLPKAPVAASKDATSDSSAEDAASESDSQDHVRGTDEQGNAAPSNHGHAKSHPSDESTRSGKMSASAEQSQKRNIAQKPADHDEQANDTVTNSSAKVASEPLTNRQRDFVSHTKTALNKGDIRIFLDLSALDRSAVAGRIAFYVVADPARGTRLMSPDGIWLRALPSNQLTRLQGNLTHRGQVPSRVLHLIERRLGQNFAARIDCLLTDQCALQVFGEIARTLNESGMPQPGSSIQLDFRRMQSEWRVRLTRITGPTN